MMKNNRMPQSATTKTSAEGEGGVAIAVGLRREANKKEKEGKLAKIERASGAGNLAAEFFCRWEGCGLCTARQPREVCSRGFAARRRLEM